MTGPSQPPRIQPVTDAAARPFWSVMMPVYNPRPEYLRAALSGVLDQDPGPDRMQIRVVDDCSEGAELEPLLREAGGGRVEYERQPENAGMARNWNRAVEAARGHWVHLLHQDDLVLPGFYQRLRQAIEKHPRLGGACVQHYLIDGDGNRRRMMSQNPAAHPGIVEDWIEYVFVQLSFQTPAIVVKREAYEELGGFRTDLRYALDWDMWKRVASAYPLWYDPEPLACYRRHEEAASMGFFASGENMAEVRRSIELSCGYLPAAEAGRVASAARRHYAKDAIDAALHALFTLRNWPMARVQLREARKFGLGREFAPLLARRFAAGVRRWREDRGQAV